MEKLKITDVYDLTVEHEGLRRKPYKCTAGKTTIGIGRNLDDVGMNFDEIQFLFKNDFERVTSELTTTFDWYEEKPKIVKCVMFDMCFNLGISRFSNFKNTLRLIKASDYEAAAKEMLDSTWSEQVGQRAITLSNMLKNA